MSLSQGSTPIPYVYTQLERNFIAFEKNPETAGQAKKRLSAIQTIIKIETSQKSIFEKE